MPPTVKHVLWAPRQEPAWKPVVAVILCIVALLHTAHALVRNSWKAELVSYVRESHLASLRSRVRNIVFGGGGYKGLGFVGVLKALCQNRRANWFEMMEGLRVCAGSSIGAVAAACVAMGATPWEIERFTVAHDYSIAKWGGIAQFSNLSVFDPSVLRRMCRDVVQTFGGNSKMTFAQAHAKFGRHLKIYVTNLTKQRVERLDHVSTPNMRVAKALYISCSVPIAFPPVEIRGDMYVDGGVFYHSPGAGEYDPAESLFIHLSEPISSGKNWLSYLHLLYRSTLNASIVLLRERYPITQFCTVRVVSRASMLNLFSKGVDKRAIMREGRNAVHAFLRPCDAVTAKLWNFIVQNRSFQFDMDRDEAELEAWLG